MARIGKVKIDSIILLAICFIVSFFTFIACMVVFECLRDARVAEAKYRVQEAQYQMYTAQLQLEAVRHGKAR